MDESPKMQSEDCFSPNNYQKLSDWKDADDFKLLQWTEDSGTERNAKSLPNMNIVESNVNDMSIIKRRRHTEMHRDCTVLKKTEEKTKKTSVNYTCNKNAGQIKDINVDITGIEFTKNACASLVNEILKGILYQKAQLPYPYSWLKHIVTKRRSKTSTDNNKRKNYTVENYYRVVSGAYDTLEEIMYGINKEFTLGHTKLKEVVILLGTSPMCPNEMYTITIAQTNFSEEQNNLQDIRNVHSTILRRIFLSQDWVDSIDASSVCSNTFVFIKKENKLTDESLNNPCFVPCKCPTISNKIKHIKINIKFNNTSEYNCSDDFTIFEETNVSVQEENLISWYQSKKLLKGFKECYVNKVSASELW